MADLTRPTGSLMNNIAANLYKYPEPTVGMGATRLGWTDRDPYTIIAVNSSKTTITVQEDRATRVDTNGMSESQQYTYEADPAGRLYVLTLRKNGRWVVRGEPMKNGTPFAIGHREKYHDYSF